VGELRENFGTDAAFERLDGLEREVDAIHGWRFTAASCGHARHLAQSQR
jgi:hypothetical protein